MEEYIIDSINEKELPISEGFWNNNPIIFAGRVLAMQNVCNNQNQNDNCLENERRVLMFDSKDWYIVL